MKRFLAGLGLLLLPFVAAGQILPGPVSAPPRTLYDVPHVSGPDTGVVMPLWRAADGRMLALVSTSGPADTGHASAAHADVPDFNVVDASALFSQSLRYDIAPRLQAHVSVSQRSWLTPASGQAQAGGCVPSAGMGCVDGQLVSRMGLVNGELGATFHGDHYSVGLNVGHTQSRAPASPVLPRVVPNAALQSAQGVPYTAFGDSSHVGAEGRLSLGHDSGLDMGASVGRIRLLPGNPLGVGALNQKSLSFGVDSGPISGNIIGRRMQPEMNSASGNLLGVDHHWTSIDLGITVRLPWQGRLSFGAQNLWSSGQQLQDKTQGNQPDQSRIPYVQYHQDL